MRKLKNQKEALEYRLQASTDVAKICDAFITKFGITNFIFAKFDNNNDRVDLCTNQQWLRFYFKNQYKLDISFLDNMWNIENNKKYYWIWPTPSKRKTDILLALHAHNMAHGITVFEKRNNSLFTWCFTTTQENYDIKKIYVKHISELSLFIDQFEEQSDIIIKNCVKIKTVCAYPKVLKNIYKPTMHDKINCFKEQIAQYDYE